MDVATLIKCATNSKHKEKGKDEKKFLSTITHLSLDKRQIDQIENLDLCPSLSVLYMNENLITKMEGMNSLKNLT